MIYEYVCQDCGEKKNISHKMTESPEILCDKCSSQMRRIISGGLGTSFKGSGWSQDRKFKKFMTKKSQNIGKIMNDHKQPVNNINDLKHIL